jgi:hypothetical protein
MKIKIPIKTNVNISKFKGTLKENEKTKRKINF